MICRERSAPVVMPRAFWPAVTAQVATTLAMRNLAEVRIRRGRLDGVEAVIRGSASTNRHSGNTRGETEDLALS